MPPVLSVRDLSVSMNGTKGRVPVLEHLSFDVAQGRTMALVGESGCGKKHDRARDHAAIARRLSRHLRQHSAGWRRGFIGITQGVAQPARRQDVDDLPGADDGAQPALHGR